MKYKKLITIIAVTVVLFVGSAIAYNLLSDRVDTTVTTTTRNPDYDVITDNFEIGDPVPDLVLPLYNRDETLDLSDFRGKTVILNFWTTSCGYCRRDKPTLQRISDELDQMPDASYVLLTVARMDDYLDTQNRLDGYMQDHDYTFPVMMDHGGKNFFYYHVYSVPTTLIVDSDGTLAYQFKGPINYDLLMDAVEALES